MKNYSLKRLAILTDEGRDAYLDFISKLPSQGLLFAFALLALGNTISKPEVNLILGSIITALLFLSFALAFYLNAAKLYKTLSPKFYRWHTTMYDFVKQRYPTNYRNIILPITLSFKKRPIESIELFIFGLLIQVCLAIVITFGFHMAKNIHIEDTSIKNQRETLQQPNPRDNHQKRTYDTHTLHNQ